MPTRTEVIQALRARDELQNRDLALLLDYLEQVAGSSSGTRATILASRRRIQDEVTPRDIEAIYNYLAELGTPANGFEILRRLLRRRDLFGIQVANFIMDEIDGASFAPSAFSDPQFLFRTDLISTLWQDASATMPVTAHGQNVAAIDATPESTESLRLTATSAPTYDTSPTMGGAPVIQFGSGDYLTATPAVISYTSGITYIGAYSIGGSSNGRGPYIYGANSGDRIREYIQTLPSSSHITQIGSHSGGQSPSGNTGWSYAHSEATGGATWVFRSVHTSQPIQTQTTQSQTVDIGAAEHVGLAESFGGGASSGYLGEVGLFGVWNRILTAQELYDIQQWIFQTWPQIETEADTILSAP